MRLSKHHRGNILFLILLAVVLFAALSYAVTSSMRGGGKDVSPEKIQTQIAMIENYGNQLRVALQRMTLTGGLKLWQIDYSHSSTRSLANGNCVTDNCKLFNTNGGGQPTLPFQPISCKAHQNATPWKKKKVGFVILASKAWA